MGGGGDPPETTRGRKEEKKKKHIWEMLTFIKKHSAKETRKRKGARKSSNLATKGGRFVVSLLKKTSVGKRVAG